jgi:hypothetical protein
MEQGLMTEEQIRKFNTEKAIVNLYKGFLIILEDVRQAHLSREKKLAEILYDDVEILKSSDFFDDEKAGYLRKRVLDMGNDCIRNLGLRK